MAESYGMAIEDLITHTDNSIYKLSILVAQRALQIAEDSKDLMSQTRDIKPISAALEEVRDGKIGFQKIKTS